MSGSIVIVGGGHNGLAAAAYLAKAGLRVTVFEADEALGGLARCRTLHPGYRIPGVLPDTGHVRPRVVKDLGLARFGLEWREPAPIWIPGPADSAQGQAKAQDSRQGIWIERDQVRGAIASADASTHGEYRAQLGRLASVVGPVLDQLPPDPQGKLWPLIKTGWRVKKLDAADMTELLRVGPMPVADWMRERFASPHLSAALALPALSGAYMAPRSPGSAGNLLFHELTRGPELVGGSRALIAALDQAARGHGADIRTGARVSRIVLDTLGTRVTAVEVTTPGGVETVATDRVAVSCDPRTAFLSLIGARYLPARLCEDIHRVRARGIVAQVDLALSGPLENPAGELVEHVRIADTLDDIERAFDPVKYGAFASRPALDIRVPSAADPDLCATPGHHVASIRAYFAPRDLAGGWTEKARSTFLEAVIARASEHLPGLRERIVASDLVTPADMEARYRVTGGHVFHAEHALDQLLFMRPTISCGQYRTPIRGLYLCGSGSHPGGGLSCAPGALAASAIEAESYSPAT